MNTCNSMCSLYMLTEAYNSYALSIQQLPLVEERMVG